MSRKPVFCVVKETIEKIESLVTLAQTHPQKTNEAEAVQLMAKLVSTLSMLLDKMTGGQIKGIGAPRAVVEFNGVLEQINKEVMGYYQGKIQEAKKMMASENDKIFVAESSIQRDVIAEFTSGVAQLRVTIQNLRGILVTLIPLEGVGKEIVRMLNFAEQLKTVTSPQNRDDFLTLVKSVKNVGKKIKEYNVEYMAFDMLGVKMTLPLQIQDFSMFRQPQVMVQSGGSNVQDKIVELQKKLQKLTGDNVQLKRENAEKQKKCDELNETINQLMTQVKELEENVKVLNNKCKNYQTYGQTDMNNLKQLEEKQKAETEEIRAELTSLLEKMREQNREESAFEQTLIEEVEQHRQAMSKMQNECDGLKLQLAQYQNGAQNINSLQEELIQYKKGYEEYQRENQRLDNENKQYQQLIEDLRQKADESEKKKEDTIEEFNKMKAELDETKSQLQEKENSVVGITTKLEEKSQELAVYVQAYSELLIQNQQQEAKIMELIQHIYSTPQPPQPSQPQPPYPQPDQKNTMSTPNGPITTSVPPPQQQPPQPPQPEMMKYPLPLKSYYNLENVTLTVKGMSFTVQLDPSTVPGIQFKLENMGEPVNGIPRDLIVELDIQQDDVYRREEYNLVQTVVFPRQYEGMQSTNNIPIITGQEASCTFLIQNGFTVTLPGYGFTKPDRTKGDYLIQVKLQ